MILKSLSKNFFNNLIFIILIFTLDRITKIYVIYFSDKLNNSELFLSKYLNISLTWNEGIAFGLFSFNQNYLYNFLTLIIFFVIFVIFIMIIKSEGIKKYALSMIFGGALGNFYDRIIFKAVPDFVDFHIGDFHWFVFNMADIFITLGVIFIILLELFTKNKEIHEQI